MKTKATGLLKASAIAIALLGSTAIVATFALPDVAYAKEGKGKGGGNGGGKGGGNGGGNGKGGGNDGGNGKGGGQGASKADGKKSAGKSGRKSGGKSAGGGPRSKSSKGGGFSLKDLFSGKKSKSKTTKKTPKTVRVARKPQATVQVTEPVRHTPRTKGNKMADLLGVHPSELGALNAANASENALKNAAPNSRVGLIAAYRDTVLAGDELRTDLEEKQALLDGMTPPDRPVSEIDEDLEAALADVQEKQDRVDQLEEDLEAAGGSDPDIEAELDDANAELQDSIDAAEDLNAERQVAAEYEDTVAEVEDLTEALENQPETEREALENAANKPVTDEVEAAVKSLLGL